MLIQKVYIKVQTTGYTQNQLCQKICKKKDAARDLKRTTLCVKHDGANVMAWACLAAS